MWSSEGPRKNDKTLEVAMCTDWINTQFHQNTLEQEEKLEIILFHTLTYQWINQNPELIVGLFCRYPFPKLACIASTSGDTCGLMWSTITIGEIVWWFSKFWGAGVFVEHAPFSEIQFTAKRSSDVWNFSCDCDEVILVSLSKSEKYKT